MENAVFQEILSGAAMAAWGEWHVLVAEGLCTQDELHKALANRMNFYLKCMELEFDLGY